MTELLSKAELGWVHKVVQPYMPAPAVMFLGGSRGGLAGQQALKSSDYDILLLADKVEQPLSLTLQSPAGNKFDLILRDPDTLAYDVESARNGGNGTLLHLCAFSHVLQDTKGMGAHIQQQAQRIFAAGPRPVTLESLDEELMTGFEDVKRFNENAARKEAHAPVTALTLTHRFGRMALRANRQWTANGKVTARFLGAHLPEFKTKLEEAAADLYSEYPEKMERLVFGIPDLHKAGADAVPLVRKYEHPAQPSVAEAYHYGRLSTTALNDYLQSGQPVVKEAAQDWVHYKFNLTASAVDAERFARPNGEYGYALGRHVGQAMEVACLSREIDPASRTLAERLSMLGNFAPDFMKAVPAAQAGNPAALHAAGEGLLRLVVPEPKPFAPRPMPATHRLSAREIGLI